METAEVAQALPHHELQRIQPQVQVAEEDLAVAALWVVPVLVVVLWEEVLVVLWAEVEDNLIFT